MSVTNSEEKRLQHIIFAFFIVFLFVIFLEVILRTTHIFGARKISFTRPDPIIGYEFIPCQDYWYKSENDHPVTGKINSFGWRDKEWSVAKHQNMYRIAVLGDSFVEAFQIESESTFLALAEEQLSNETGFDVQLMNFGRSRYSQAEELLVLKRNVELFSPDMVVLFFFPGNDITEINKNTAPDTMRPFYEITKSGELILDISFSHTTEFKIKSFISLFRQHSAIISLLSDRYLLYRAKRDESDIIDGKAQQAGVNGYLSLCTSRPEQIYFSNFSLCKQLIRLMAEHCKRAGIKFMLVCCDVNYVSDLQQFYEQTDSIFNPNYFDDEVREFAKSIDISYLGLQRIFHQSCEDAKDSCHWKGFGHWNYKGHRLVAEHLVRNLKSIILAEKPKLSRF